MTDKKSIDVSDYFDDLFSDSIIFEKEILDMCVILDEELLRTHGAKKKRIYSFQNMFIAHFLKKHLLAH